MVNGVVAVTRRLYAEARGQLAFHAPSLPWRLIWSTDRPWEAIAIRFVVALS